MLFSLIATTFLVQIDSLYIKVLYL